MPRSSQAPLGPKARYVSFPIVTKARLRVLPYLMKMGLQKEEVDGDDVAGEPKLGYYAPQVSLLLGVIQIAAIGH